MIVDVQSVADDRSRQNFCVVSLVADGLYSCFPG